MQTQPLFTFLVRKSFGPYKEKDIFEAVVRTFVEELVEKQDFILPDGTVHKGIPCSWTKFHDKIS